MNGGANAGSETVRARAARNGFQVRGDHGYDGIRTACSLPTS